MTDPRDGCPDFDQRLFESLFAPSPDAELDRHLGSCVRCRRARDLYLSTADAIRSGFGVEAGGGSPRGRVLARAAAVLIVASLLASALLVVSTWRRDDPENPAGAPAEAPAAVHLDKDTQDCFRALQTCTLSIDGVAEILAREGAEIALESRNANGPEVRLLRGCAGIRPERPLHVLVHDAELRAGAGADLDVEILREREGSMNKTWLIPVTALAAATPIAIAILVKQGPADLSVPERDGAQSLPAAAVQVIERPDVSALPDQRIPVLEARVESLTRDLVEAKKTAEKLQDQIAKLETENAGFKAEASRHDDAKSATVNRVLAGIDALKDKGLATFLSPGATAQLVSDLKALGAEGVRALLPLLQAEDENARLLAAKLLEDLADPASIPALRDTALNDQAEMVANMASHALALMDSPETIESLHRIVAESKHEDARVNSLFGLAKHGDPKGIGMCLAYMKDDENPKMLKAALGYGFTLTSDARLIPLVNEFVSQNKDESRALTLAVDYYKKVGTPAARAELERLAASEQAPASVREAARAALGR